MTRRPNILFLMTDQLRLDHTGFGAGAGTGGSGADRRGGPIVATPNIDRIAEGTAFLSCMTVNPICTPARSALLTGKYTHQIGMVSMSGDLSLQHPTYPQALQKAGFQTWGIGKFHFLQTWRWGTGTGDGLDLTALRERMKEYGFDHVWEAAGKQLSRQNSCDYCAYLDERGLLESYRDFVESAGRNVNFLSDIGAEAKNGDPSPLRDEDHVDAVIADRIIDAIRDRDRERPFFIFGSFCSPHKPFDPPARYLDAEPEIEWEPIVDEVASDATRGDPQKSAETRRLLQRQARSYRALVRFTDDQIGRVCDELEREGLLDETVILFTTDHGELLGDHGLVQKQSYYRGSLTVPTAIRHPDHLDGKRSLAPVEITDLTATILDIAGLDPADVLSKPWPAFHTRAPCRSLMPIVSGAAESVRDFAFSECNGIWQTIVDSRYKYVRFLDRGTDGKRLDGSSAERLFDLESDPSELVDLLGGLGGEESLAGEAKCALAGARARREWVNDTTPPAQTRWAPLPEAGERFSYPTAEPDTPVRS